MGHPKVFKKSAQIRLILIYFVYTHSYGQDVNEKD